MKINEWSIYLELVVGDSLGWKQCKNETQWEVFIDYQVYMHGQVLGTHSFWLKGEFLQPDEYSEIREKYFLPGGETGTICECMFGECDFAFPVAIKSTDDGRGRETDIENRRGI